MADGVSNCCADTGANDYTSYHAYTFPSVVAIGLTHDSCDDVDEKQYPTVQAAIILEVGIHSSEGLEKRHLNNAATIVSRPTTISS
jgi:hypothetical protein